MTDDLTRLGLVDDDDIDLDEAALALALLDHPETDPAPYAALLATMAERLRHVGAAAVVAPARADALASVLGGEFGLVGDGATYDDPANADLMAVLDRRRGLPVTLSILYVAAARRIGWEADVLDVPGHVLVLIGAEDDPLVIDPFAGGTPVSPEQLAAMLPARDGEGPAEPRQVAAMPNRAVLVRLLLNQATRAEQAGQGRRALDLYRRMTVFAPGHAHPWWQRARLELVDGDVAAARMSLAAMLEVTREPELRERITGVLDGLVAG